MKSYLLIIGDGAGSLLPILCGVSAGMAGAIPSLGVFRITQQADSSPFPRITEDLNACHAAFAAAGESHFPVVFSYASCSASLPDIRELTAREEDASLLAALRGKGLPISWQTDRGAVSWAFSAMLAEKAPSLAPFLNWVYHLQSEADLDRNLRLTLVFDPSDSFASGAAVSLIRFLRQRFSDDTVFLSMIGLFAPDHSGTDARRDLASLLSFINERSLLRRLEGEFTHGADALWLLSLPASFRTDSGILLGLSVARILGSLADENKLPACGLHTRSLPGILTWKALDPYTGSVFSFIRTSVWFLADILPHFREGHMLPRNSLSRLLQKVSSGHPGFPARLAPLERSLRLILSEFTTLLRSLPDELRDPETSDARWAAAVSACGRSVTTASELDVSRAEAEESGLDRVMPVHRVSMEDTEEERLLRRLDEMEEQLARDLSARDQAFSRLGGARSAQVLWDCRARCVSACEKTKDRFNQLMSSPDTEHLAIASAARRIRLLEAAVARCDEDWKKFSRDDQVSSPAEGMPAGLPDRLLHPEVLRLLEQYLREDYSSEKPLRDHLVDYLPGHPLSDEKLLLKKLMKPKRLSESSGPADFFAAMNRVILEEAETVRWSLAGSVPDLPLLPYCYAETAPVTLSALIPMLPEPVPEMDEAALRGLWALLTLLQYRRPAAEDPVLITGRFTADRSPLIASWLISQQSEEVRILSLKKNSSEQPFALLLPGRAILPAKWTEAHLELVPPFVSWFDRENGRFLDPCSLLSETDREILVSQLAEILEALPENTGASTLRGFISRFRDELKNNAVSPETADLPVRLRSVCGLRELHAYRDSLRRIECRYEHALHMDKAASCLTGSECAAVSVSPDAVDILYAWRGMIFARENPVTFLSSVPFPEEAFILKTLADECDTLEPFSDDYRDALVRNLLLLREKYPEADPDCLAVLDRLLKESGEPIREKVTKLSWPWDHLSPSVRTLFRECLGETLAESAVLPFSDRLTICPTRGGEILGDTLLSGCCSIAPLAPSAEQEAASEADSGHTEPAPSGPALADDALLPPLSPAFAASLCLTAEGRTLIKPDFLEFRRLESGAIRVQLTLNGNFTACLSRTYSPDEFLTLYSNTMPTVAVWPDLPFDPDMWRAYFVYAHFPESFQVSVLQPDGTETILPLEDGSSVTCLSASPVCLFLRQGDQSVGSVPNLLPKPQLPEGGPVTVCIDFGSSASSVIFSSRGGNSPMHGASAVRTLLANPAASRDLLRKEFLPAVPVSALLPSVVRLRNSPDDKLQPFRRGLLLMASGLRDVMSLPSGALYTCMKWEDPDGEAMTLCIHQVMLIAALQARLGGASSLLWRFAVPDEMASEGRVKWADTLRSAAETVLTESGFPQPEEKSPVLFASESQALGAYFRFCASEDTRGGFMVMDLGSSTADISLFLRNRETAVRTCQIPLGIHYMLLPSLLSDPDLLLNDFGFIPEERFLNDLAVLRNILAKAHADPAALRHARLALDTFIADHSGLLTSVIGQSILAGSPGRLASLLLLHFSFLMMMAGLILLQIAADPNRNDFLPEQMSLCISGRGARLIQSLPDPVKTGLWHFLTMFRNKRVASLSLLFSAEKKMEIPVGLSMLTELSEDRPPAGAVPVSMAVRPEELLPEFLLRFLREFPASAALLFRDFYTSDFYHPFTQRGEAMISSAIAQTFTLRETPRPFDALSAWIGSLLELLRENR